MVGAVTLPDGVYVVVPDDAGDTAAVLLVVALVVTVTLPEGVKLPPKVELEPVKVGFETVPFG